MDKFYNEVEKMDLFKTQIWLTPMVDHLPYVPGVGPWSEASVWKLSARQEFPEQPCSSSLLIVKKW